LAQREASEGGAKAAGGARDGLVSGSIGLASRASSQLVLLAVTLVATRMLTVAEFGAYAIAAALMFLARNLLYVGAYEYLLKAPDENRAADCLVVNLGVGLAAMAGFALLSLASQPLFGTDEVRLLLLALLPSVLMVALTSWYEALLLKRHRIRPYYAVTLAAELIGGVVAVACLVAGVGVLSLVVQTYARLGSMILAYALIGARPVLQAPERAAMRLVFDWSGRRYLAAFLNFGSNYGADLVLGVLMTPAATGIFRAAHRIVHALADLFVQPLLKIAQMQVSTRMAAGLGPGSDWLRMFTGVAAVGWAALAGLAATAAELVPIVLGHQWDAAAPVVSVLCAVRAFSLLDSVSTAVLVACDRQQFMLRVQIAVTVAVIGLSAVAAPFGPVWVAVATGLVSLILSLVYAHEARRLSAIGAEVLNRALLTALAPAAMVVVAVIGTRALGGEAATLPVLLSAGLVAGVAGLALMRRPVVDALAAIGRRAPAAQASAA
jgi:O-antigen/teichoic acid export membrane protein